MFPALTLFSVSFILFIYFAVLVCIGLNKNSPYISSRNFIYHKKKRKKKKTIRYAVSSQEIDCSLTETVKED